MPRMWAPIGASNISALLRRDPSDDRTWIDHFSQIFIHFRLLGSKDLTMGWMSQRQPSDSRVVQTETRKPATTKVEAYADHVELIERTESSTFQKWDMQDPSVLDNDLPFIPPDLVRKQRLGNNHGLIWLVVDSIVYDCTNFIAEHPGGETVIRSFISEDCSWQFWRFHSPAIMEEFGRPLRVGRTEGIRNRFEEPPRYVGMSRLE